MGCPGGGFLPLAVINLLGETRQRTRQLVPCALAGGNVGGGEGKLWEHRGETRTRDPAIRKAFPEEVLKIQRTESTQPGTA